MKQSIYVVIMITGLILPVVSNAYESGSSGVDGAFSPSSNIQVQLPPSGIFNYTDVSIPSGVTVTFAKNSSNTPVIILASGNVTINGTISVNGGNGGNYNNGAAGKGGPGGYDGGRGGFRSDSNAMQGGNGLGPGGGEGAPNCINCSGGGGSYGSQGQNGTLQSGQGAAGPTYGSGTLRTLIGGSGGGGAAGNGNAGPGGGGGGGAILIAASGTVTINGTVTARGGSAGSYSNSGQAGSGSGGAIRIIATTIQGEGTITAQFNNAWVDGGDGRIRLEAETYLRTAATTPGFTFASPKPIFFSNSPSVRITTVGSETVPSSPSGFRDVVLPGATANPVTVGFETTNIPVGTTISLTATPPLGSETTAVSTPVSGSTTLGTASADINLPGGNSVLLGLASFTATVSDTMGRDYSKYAQGEQVEKVRVSVNTDGKSETTFITVSGREYTWPSNAVAMQ